MNTSNIAAAPRPHLLVVDDEASFRRALRISLEAAGFVVDEARTSEEAVESVRAGAFDLVVLDHDMPGMNGVEACRQIRSLSQSTGIVMVTVRSDPDDRVRALEAGPDDFVAEFSNDSTRETGPQDRNSSDRGAG